MTFSLRGGTFAVEPFNQSRSSVRRLCSASKLPESGGRAGALSHEEKPIEVRSAKPNNTNQLQVLMTYAAELELEVDRLRRRDQFLQHEAREQIARIKQHSAATSSPQNPVNPLLAIEKVCSEFGELLRDLNELPGYHPAFDQVVAIAVQPLAEQIFRSQQRFSGARNAVLRLDLATEYITWFPARLHHILDNLISNALRYRDVSKGEVRVSLALRQNADGYELKFTDNGLGIPKEQLTGMFELFYRAAPIRAAGLGVGLAIVKLLVEKCCGSFAIESGEGQGTSVTICLPRYDVDDHVE
jgi:signal transduction histidine kinase